MRCRSSATSNQDRMAKESDCAHPRTTRQSPHTLIASQHTQDDKKGRQPRLPYPFARASALCASLSHSSATRSHTSLSRGFIDFSANCRACSACSRYRAASSDMIADLLSTAQFAFQPTLYVGAQHGVGLTTISASQNALRLTPGQHELHWLVTLRADGRRGLNVRHGPAKRVPLSKNTKFDFGKAAR